MSLGHSGEDCHHGHSARSKSRRTRGRSMRVDREPFRDPPSKFDLLQPRTAHRGRRCGNGKPRRRQRSKNCDAGHSFQQIGASKVNYAYILKCADGTLYTGWTNDLGKRLKAHNGGTGGRYTRTRRPVELIYSEGFDTKREAQSREFAIKRLSRQEKQTLIDGNRDEQVAETAKIKHK